LELKKENKTPKMNYQGRGRHNRAGRGPPRRFNNRRFHRGNGRGFGRGRSTSNFSTNFPAMEYNLLHTPKGKQIWLLMHLQSGKLFSMPRNI
jgi:hypothetical protein